MSTLLIALRPNSLTDEQLASVEAAAADMQVVITNDRERIEALLPDVRIVLGMFPRDLLAKAPRLEWFQQWGAGADWLLEHPQVVDSDLLVTNTAGVHAVPIGEHVLAYLLAFARGLPSAMRHQLERDWRPLRQAELFELEGKSMLLVGAGRVGSRVAHLGSAFGMHVAAVRRNAELPVEGAATVHATGELLGLLPTADFVVLTVPLTADTRGLIGAPQLAAMKDTAYLVNIGRGGTVDEPALIAALTAGKLAGAGLDVFEEEPLPPTSPLWTMENVIITSHYAGATPRYVERVLEIFLDNLARFKRGEPLRNEVDKRLGY
ncbi:MAG TPA: D-2-hydroxyacid dehydrogenase [Trueperaceae bacterium]|nr:D-2-hydroxyacid dehydrogenase [Trueperaceae bacterium]